MTKDQLRTYLAELVDEVYGNGNDGAWVKPREQALRKAIDRLPDEPASPQELKCPECGCTSWECDGCANLLRSDELLQQLNRQTEPKAPRVCADSADGNHVLKQDGPFGVVYCDACGMNKGHRADVL